MGTELTDEELYDNFIYRDDEDAMCALFEKYCDSLIRFISGIVNNEDDAEEIMMDTFVTVIGGSAKFTARGGSSFKTWLYAVAKRTAFFFLRKNNRTESLEVGDDHPAGEHTIPENIFLEADKTRELSNALKYLTPDQRTVLYLKFFEDMDTEEISRVMHKSVRQIYKLTDKGKTRLRELLAGRELL